MENSPSPALSSANNSLSAAQETEKQLWEIVKSIPGLNVTYGTVTCIVYVIKKDDKESTASAIAAAKGAVQTAVVTAGVVTAPVSIPVAAGGVLTGIAAKSVSDTVEILVFFVTNSEQLQGKDRDERERVFYNKIKNVAGVGALYSALRVPVYLLKKNKQQTVESSIGFVENSGDTAVQIGVSMIPNIDEQLQKMIEKTARCAIKHLAKKVKDQISRQNLPIEQGLQTIAKVENDCQTIIEATGQMGESSSSLEKLENAENGQRTASFSRENDHKNKSRNCAWISWCCCCCQTRGKVEPTDSHSAPIPDGNHGHLIILTE